MIEPRYGTLQMLLADRIFAVPPYQRFFSWGPDQLEDLFNDLRQLDARPKTQHHFMATLVSLRTDESHTIGANNFHVHDIVDGQQRLTTLLILLKCIEHALPEGSDDRDDLARVLVKRDGRLALNQSNNPNDAVFSHFLREGALLPPEQMHTHADALLAAAIRGCLDFVRRWAGDNGPLG